MLGLLGFHDELDNRPGRPNGSIRKEANPHYVETHRVSLPDAFLHART
ncbi:hypothetical protein ACGFWE_28795 [Streptomyces sp. NPDC048523]